MHEPCAEHYRGDRDGGSVIFPRRILVEQDNVMKSKDSVYFIHPCIPIP